MRDNRSLFVISTLLFIIVLKSCVSNERVIPNSSGKSSEILVVAEKNTWNGPVGEVIRSVFGQEIYGLPQPEPMYSLPNIAESDFSTIFQSHRNLFIVSIKPEYNKPFIETKRDLWAKPQRIIKINAAYDSAALRLFNENKQAFISMFDQMERERIQKAYAGVTDVSILRQLVETFNI